MTATLIVIYASDLERAGTDMLALPDADPGDEYSFDGPGYCALPGPVNGAPVAYACSQGYNAERRAALGDLVGTYARCVYDYDLDAAPDPAQAKLAALGLQPVQEVRG
jgi:hypothetical protein